VTRARFAEERRQFVLRELAVRGRVEAAALASALDVSMESVRKDLAQLEEHGQLRRVHGGAIPLRDLTFEQDVAQRADNAAQKDAIARAALAHVPAGGSLLLDAGSTTARLAVLLPSDLYVCTNALTIAAQLAARADLTVRCLGGTVRRATLAGVGQVTLDALAAVNVDVAFLGTNGISHERGLTTPDEQEALVKNRMLASARRRVLLADSSKFGLESLCRHAEITDLDLVITDARVRKADVRALESAGVEVQIA
jgi:DeoR family transcriptional regulator, fructose operon transcriptional repressor